MHGRFGLGSRLLFVALAIAAPAALGAGGCFAISDLERFHAGQAEAGAPDDPNATWDLELTMKGMGVHLNQLIEFRIIDNNNYVQARGVIDPLDQPASESVTFTLPLALPPENRPYRLDFYGDVNGTRSYDGLDTGVTHDHAWRIDPLVDYPSGKFPHVSNKVQVIFTHNKAFTDIDEWPKGTENPCKDTGLGVLIQFEAAKMTEFVGKLLQVRVVEARSGHTVGVYRNPQVPATDFEGFIAGVVEDEEDYNIDVYIDLNDNGVYDNPKSVGSNLDLGWRFTEKAHNPSGGTAGAGGTSGVGGAGGGAGGPLVGLSLKFDPKSKPGVEDVGAP